MYLGKELDVIENIGHVFFEDYGFACKIIITISILKISNKGKTFQNNFNINIYKFLKYH